jgi:arginyl-tRNA synthetase
MLENILSLGFIQAFIELYGAEPAKNQLIIQKTRSEFEGDRTIVMFPFVKVAKRSPEQIAAEIGAKMKQSIDIVENFNVIKGFLNLSVSDHYWLNFFNQNHQNPQFGLKEQTTELPVVVEYSSPNTNKPLHLGHVRNNLLGYSVSEILKANGHKVVKVNLVNDRGIHICKSMLAWQKWGNGRSPENEDIKGDKLVGEMYVRFDKELKLQLAEMPVAGIDEDALLKKAPLMIEAQEMLQKWEAGDPETRLLWKTMNTWVYAGFDETYKRLGVDFDKIYYESQTYLLGKDLVKEGVESGVLFKKEDESVWCDLTADGLDEKLLLRADGTSVYMTQDLGTAELRANEYHPSKLIYVVGNEQNYHFDVLKLVLLKLQREWADAIEHLSYGMVELPQGKMKSREGTVVDADELMDEMVLTAKTMTEELGKSDNLSETEAARLYNQIGMGALKYFILKVDPKKTMMFNPQESVDFNGNTGPFIQYTHARINSLLRRSVEYGTVTTDNSLGKLLPKEKSLVLQLHNFPEILAEAGANRSPALIANYLYDLAKDFNQFYQEIPILKEEDATKLNFRLLLCTFTQQVLKSASALLGMEMPEKM